jgi:hypothetical protein
MKKWLMLLPLSVVGFALCQQSASAQIVASESVFAHNLVSNTQIVVINRVKAPKTIDEDGSELDDDETGYDTPGSIPQDGSSYALRNGSTFVLGGYQCLVDHGYSGAYRPQVVIQNRLKPYQMPKDSNGNYLPTINITGNFSGQVTALLELCLAEATANLSMQGQDANPVTGMCIDASIDGGIFQELDYEPGAASVTIAIGPWQQVKNEDGELIQLGEVVLEAAMTVSGSQKTPEG